MAIRLKYLLSVTALTGAVILLLWNIDIRPGLLAPGALQPTQISGNKFPLTLTDAVGRTVQLSSPPERIVSATLVTDEILAALVDSSRIKGVTFLADNPSISNIPGHYPEEITRISGEVEEIIALQPDLVFISAYTRAETVNLLLNTNIPVVRLTEFNSFEEISQSFKLVAAVTGSSEKASDKLNQIALRLKKLQQQLKGSPRPRVLFYNLNGGSSGPNSTIDEIIALAGGFNVLRETGIKGSRNINEEFAIALQPDIVLMSGWNEQHDFSPAQQLMQRESWQHVPAVKNKQVYDLKGNWLYSTSQFSWEGIEQVATIIHPDAFPDREQK